MPSLYNHNKTMSNTLLNLLPLLTVWRIERFYIYIFFNPLICKGIF